MIIRQRSAFTHVEFVACLVCLVIGATVVSIALGQVNNADAPLSKKTVKDATQMRGVHQSWIIFAKEFQGLFPVPGMINRLPVEGLGNVPGRGEEDITQNTTANLHSSMVMANYYSPDLLISPVERNPKMRVCVEYNYEGYDVVNDVFWDSNFKADLAQLSHVSFANMPLAGERRVTQWRDTLDAKFSVIGNRGPKDGLTDPSSFTCGPHGNWAGNIVFHTEFFNSPIWKIEKDGVSHTDNFFADDRGILLAFTRKIIDKSVDLQFD